MVMEDFKRPNHPDFLSSSELKDAKFSGIRHNSITGDAELWLLGSIVERVTKEQILLDPLAFNKAYERAFALDRVMPDTPEARQFENERNKVK